MNTLQEDRIRRVEHNLLAWAAMVYAGVSIFGSVFKVPWMQSLTSDPRVLVPAIGAFIFLLVRRSIRQSDDLAKFTSAASHLLFQPSIVKTHGSMWERAEEARTGKVWATYLNPEAFKDGQPATNVKEFYARAEKFEIADYRRVFAVYPAKPQYEAVRRRSIEWLRGHVERTRPLKGYEVRYVEIEFQAAEMWIDDAGINFSFPSSRATEAGWATSEPRAIEMAKDYFVQLWMRAHPVDELLREA